MLAHSRQTRPHRNVRHRFELDQVHNRHRAVPSRDIGTQMQVRAQKGRPMLAQQHNQCADGYYDGQEINTKVSRSAHVGLEILPRGLSPWLGMGTGVPTQTFTRLRIDAFPGPPKTCILSIVPFRLSCSSYG